MTKTKRLLGAAAAGALTLGGLTLATPAQAAVVADGVGFIDTQTTTDAGGVEFDVSVDWNYKYVANGVTRVAVNPLRIGTSEDIDDAGIDYRFRVYSGTVKIQDSIVDGNDHDGVNPVIRNPRNPRSNAGVTKIVVTRVGRDGDGLAGGPGLTFVQPGSIGNKPAI